MTYIIRYTETADEIARNVEAVRQSGGVHLDLMGTTPEEYVADWNDLYVTDVQSNDTIDWSLGGCEPYEAKQFPTLTAAEIWIVAHGTTEPGVWEVIEL